MPRKPSSRILPNRVDIYSATIGRDVDGGPTATYTGSPTSADVPCSVQDNSGRYDATDQSRQSDVTSVAVIFDHDPGLKINDKIVFGTRQLFVRGTSEYVSRGIAWEVTCEERT